MNKVSVITISILILGLIGLGVFLRMREKQLILSGCTMEARICPDGSSVGRQGPKCEFDPCPSTPNANGNNEDKERTVAPLDRANERVTKKPFGIYIDKKTSPVQPERFSGYHTGTDFETFPDEALADVTVKAICDGKVLDKRSASGYGGVFVTSCVIGGQNVTVTYGHLKLSSIKSKVGDKVTAGEEIGILGAGGSSETDGERKHLHLGIHKGTSANILGYVANKNDLSGWVDSCLFVCGK